MPKRFVRSKAVPAKKLKYAENLIRLVNEYSRVLMVGVDNVGSKTVATLRKSMRGNCEFLFGKNTMVRKILSDYIEKEGRDELQNMIDIVKGNSGFCFTKSDVSEIRDIILTSTKVTCGAKAGQLSPVDVWVPAGPTGMEPTMTSFFQALGIATKINRGQIDISDKVKLVELGSKVNLSQAQLLSKLNIRPFIYGMTVPKYYDNGQSYDAAVLDITAGDIAAQFCKGCNEAAKLCLAIDYPTVVSVPHSILGAYMNMLAVGSTLEKYTWANMDKVKEILKDPSKFAASSGGGGGGGGGATGGGGAAAVVEEEEEEEESSEGGGGGLFGGSGSSSDDSSS